ncbi:hypothetical protein [uncultured Jatrophihabitans sp.]|uniref:hypothetical protein n=1 Tax=uncultured Jatrophihabitans sp. TaxID=1610747 RepID=UPI0035C9F819
MTGQLFVVERYDDTGTPGRLLPLPAPPADVRLVYAVRVPADDVVLALIEGTDEQTTSAALTAAGWRVDRITPAAWAHPGEEGAT